MRLFAALALFVFAFGLTACVPSLHPLYTAEDLTFDPALIGVWSEGECQERWTFKRAAENEYKLLHTDAEGHVGEFSARLVNVAGYRFLDLLPAEPARAGNEFYQGHFQPIHTFVLVQQTSPELRLAYLDLEWLDKQLKANPAALRHERIQGEIILTATPKELQRYLLTQLPNADAFAGKLLLQRIEAQP